MVDLTKKPKVNLDRHEEETRKVKGGLPTEQQLESINRLTRTPLSLSEVYVMPSLMIDSEVTSHKSRLHQNLLMSMVDDANSGVGLLLNHDSNKLPVGRTFESELHMDGDIMTLYGNSYIPLDRETQHGINTTNLAQSIEDGVAFDVSIGFSFDSVECSICGGDIRRYSECPHFPGVEYIITDEDGNQSIQECIAILGRNGGELIELSVVYAGACDRATIEDFSEDNVMNYSKRTKLNIVNDIKNIPENATIYQYCSNDSVAYYINAEEVNKDMAVNLSKNKPEDVGENLNLEQESIESNPTTEELNEDLTDNTEESVNDVEESIEDTVEEESIEENSEESEEDNFEEEIEEDLTEEESEDEEATESEVVEEDSVEETELDTDNEVSENDLSGDLKVLETNSDSLSKEIEELKAENEKLKADLSLVDEYRNQVIEDTIKQGIKAQGNFFQADLYRRFLKTLSISELKENFELLKKEADNRFAGVKVSAFNDKSKDELENYYFDNDSEYTDFIDEKAKEYITANDGVTYVDAVKFMRLKYKRI